MDEMREYYRINLKHLEWPEFTRWFENWYGTDKDYPAAAVSMIELYWSERRFALMGWIAATMPASESGNAASFIQQINKRIERGNG